MAKFIKPFRGVPEGEIYPVEYAVDDECPPELEAGALSVGALSLIRSDAATLVGSSTFPPFVGPINGVVLALTDVVNKAHEASGLSVEDWNALSEADRDAAIAGVLSELELSAGSARGDGREEASGGEVATPPAVEVTPASTADAVATAQDAGLAGAPEPGEAPVIGTPDKATLISQLEVAGIPFDKRWGAEKLAAALADGKKE